MVDGTRRNYADKCAVILYVLWTDLHVSLNGSVSDKFRCYPVDLALTVG